MPIDSFDKHILSHLQVQGDISQVQLSERVHLSATQCARRIARLVQEGYIERFVAVLNPKMLGLHITAHTYVSLRVHEDEANTKFRNFVKLRPEVTECYTQTGEMDYFLKLRVRDLEALNTFLAELIKVSGGLAALRSSVVLEEVKLTTQISLKYA